MRTALDVFLLVDGLLLIASARILATALKIPGDRSTAVRLLGLADDAASATYRFATSVIAGLVFAALAIADLSSSPVPPLRRARPTSARRCRAVACPRAR